MTGRETDLALYCALVVGCFSVPTFARIPSLLALKSGTSGDSMGCSAKVRVVAFVPAGMAWAVEGAIGRTPPQNSGVARVTVRPLKGDTAPRA